MTDLDKFKELFNELGILYEVEHTERGKTAIHMDESSIDDYCGYGKSLSIIFSSEGKFKEFEPWGE